MMDSSRPQEGHSRSHPPPTKCREKFFGVILFCCALACCSLYLSDALTQPIEQLLVTVADDSFFYLQIARHIAHNGQSTFDGINPTNGYHPAWMALMTLFAKLGADKEVLLRSCLVTCLFFHILSGALIVIILNRIAGGIWSWLAGAVWVMNRLPLSFCRMGLETSFYIFSLGLVILIFVKWMGPHMHRGTPFHPPTRALIRVGLALSLSFYARTEAVLLIFVMLAYLSALLIFRREGRLMSRSIWHRLLALYGSYLLSIFPWFLYSYYMTGHLLQNSSQMKILWAMDKHAGVDIESRIRSAIEFLWWPWLGVTVDALLGVPQFLLKIAPLAVFLVLIGIIFFFRGRASHVFQLTLILSIATLLTGAVYALWYTDHQLWYLAQPGFSLYIIAACWIGISIQRLTIFQNRLLGILSSSTIFLIAFLASLSFRKDMPAIYPWQRDVYTSQIRFEKLIPPSARIGCFNYCGIAAFFSDRTVINLDGLVNSNIQPYYCKHTVEKYLRDYHIAYIADEEASIRRVQRFTSAPLNLIPLDSAPLAGVTMDRRWLWRVQDPHSP